MGVTVGGVRWVGLTVGGITVGGIGEVGSAMEGRGDRNAGFGWGEEIFSWGEGIFSIFDLFWNFSCIFDGIWFIGELLRIEFIRGWFLGGENFFSFFVDNLDADFTFTFGTFCIFVFC